MAQILDSVDKELIHLLSGDLGASLTPYAEAAAVLGISEKELLTRLEGYQKEGLLRRLGATLWHQRSGFAANALLVFAVAAELTEEYGRKLAANPVVSHCYERQTAPGWPYNLYAMIHAKNRKEMLEIANNLAEQLNSPQWHILESQREFKKTSLRYFSPKQP